MSPEELQGFQAALEKYAKELVSSVAQLHPHLEKGDIMLLSPEKPKTLNPFKQLFHGIFRAGSKAVQGPYTHSAVYIGDGKLVETRIGHGASVIALNKALKDKAAVLLRPKVPEAKKEQAVGFLKEIAKKRSPYSLSSLIDTVQHHFTGLKLFKRKDGKHICSNLITDAYKGTKLVPNKDPNYVLPADFLRSPKLKPVATLVPGAK